MAVRVEIRGADELARRFANEPARAAMLSRAMDAHLGLIHGAVVPLTPVGVTSELRGSWATENTTGANRIYGVLGSPLVYAEVMEEGRRPGAPMPPPEALARWVELKIGTGVDPFVIARSIARKGIKGRHMLERAVEASRSVAGAIWSSVASRLLEES